MASPSAGAADRAAPPFRGVQVRGSDSGRSGSRHLGAGRSGSKHSGAGRSGAGRSGSRRLEGAGGRRWAPVAGSRSRPRAKIRQPWVGEGDRRHGVFLGAVWLPWAGGDCHGRVGGKLAVVRRAVVPQMGAVWRTAVWRTAAWWTTALRTAVRRTAEPSRLVVRERLVRGRASFGGRLFGELLFRGWLSGGWVAGGGLPLRELPLVNRASPGCHDPRMSTVSFATPLRPGLKSGGESASNGRCAMTVTHGWSPVQGHPQVLSEPERELKRSLSRYLCRDRSRTLRVGPNGRFAGFGKVSETSSYSLLNPLNRDGLRDVYPGDRTQPANCGAGAIEARGPSARPVTGSRRAVAHCANPWLTFHIHHVAVVDPGREGRAPGCGGGTG